MSKPSPARSAARGRKEAEPRIGFGPRRLAEFATRRPGRVLAVWGVVVLVSLGLTGTLLGSGLTSDSSLTNHPESATAQDLIDARLPGRAVDEVIVVRSERSVVSDPAFAARVRALVAQARRSGGVEQISSYLDPGGEILVSADRHATLLPVVVAHPQEDADRGPHRARRAQRRQRRVRGAHHRQPTRSTATSPSSRRAT